MNKKLRKAAVALLSTATLLGQVMPGFAGESGSATRSGVVSGIECTGIGSYKSNVASASTATPNSYSGLCAATVTARMGLSSTSTGYLVAPVSSSGAHAAVQYRYNDEGYVVNGCTTKHQVTVGSASWVDSISLLN